MILKEAYRYQNYLTNLISEAQSYLNRRDFITITKQIHNKNKVNSDAQDETIVIQKPYSLEFEPMQLVNFIKKAIDEKQKLSDAIASAKKYTEIDIDSAISMNKIKQEFTSVLNRMSSVKSSESQERGSDYKFDNEGRQGSYSYIIDSVVTIDYDRKDVRNLAKKLSKETDDISTKLDTIELTTKIDFIPTWDIGDTLEEIVVE